MGNGEIREFILSAESKIKEAKEAKAAREALKGLKEEYNKATTYDNYAKVCEKMKTAYPDNNQCKESLPADCEEEPMNVLVTGVKTCWNALNGKSSNAGCQHDNIPLLKAVCDQNYPEANKLLQEGANINAQNQNDENALHLAVKQNNSSIANLLLRTGRINVNAQDNNGNTPLMLAVAKDSNIMHNILSNTSVQCLTTNKAGQNVFHIAIENNSSNLPMLVQNWLCERGNSSSSTDIDGNTPLHLAVEKNDVDTVRLLLRHGNYREIKNNEGKTQKDLATHPTIKQLLEEQL